MTPSLTVKKLSKLPLLLRSAGKSPSEFRNRLEAVLEVKWDRIRRSSHAYQPIQPSDALLVLEAVLGPIRIFFEEMQLTTLEEEVSGELKALAAKAPFSLMHNADIELAHFCYAISRSLAPAVILESGVAYGVTSAHLLQAIELNGRGTLWSIDLPPLGQRAEEYVGFLIPEHLRKHWNLRRGVTRKLLPKLLPLIGPIDIFVQDSLHTYRTITEEIRMVWPFLRSGGVVIADDMGDNRAFEDFAESVDPSACVVVQELSKNSMFGILVKR